MGMLHLFFDSLLPMSIHHINKIKALFSEILVSAEACLSRFINNTTFALNINSTHLHTTSATQFAEISSLTHV
jgi:hypothetical protein